jgi:hypothetical protein
MATKRKKRTPKSKGLGDTIAKVTKWAGVEPCDACKKRQNKLNKWIPYNSVKGEMTQEQFDQWERFKKDWNGKSLTTDQQVLVSDIYNSVMHKNFEPCINCRGSQWLQPIKILDSVADKYK